MVPLESESTEVTGSSSSAARTERGKTGSEGAAAPIAALSKLAFQDAVLELETTVRNAQDRSSAAVFQFWQSAEKYLGKEVEIEDPAVRGLFGLHVVMVEELLQRVRSQVEATLAAVDIWSQPSLGIVASGLRAVCEPLGDEQLVAAVCGDIVDADRGSEVAQARLRARLQEEVCGRVDERLREHDALREAIRDRQRWRGCSAAARRDVARFRKGSAAGESGLPALMGEPHTTPLEQAEARLADADRQGAEVDTRVLADLSRLGGESVDAVRLPWAALVQIQADFYTAQQSVWSSLGQSCGELVDSVGGGVNNVRAPPG